MFDRLAEKLSSSHPQSSQDPLWQTCQISSLCFSSTQPRTLTFHTFHSGRAEVSEMDRTVSEVGSFHCTWNLIDSHTLFPACRKMTAQNTKAGTVGQWRCQSPNEYRIGTRAISSLKGASKGLNMRCLCLTEPQVEEKLQKLSASEEDWQQTLEPVANIWNIVAA